MFLEIFPELARGLQVAAGDDDVGIARLPVVQSLRDLVAMHVGRVLDEHSARTGKEPLRLDRIRQRRRIGAQIAREHPRQAHFLFGTFAQQVLQQILPLQRHPHRVGAIDQRARGVRRGLGEMAVGFGGFEFHGLTLA